MVAQETTVLASASGAATIENDNESNHTTSPGRVGSARRRLELPVVSTSKKKKKNHRRTSKEVHRANSISAAEKAKTSTALKVATQLVHRSKALPKDRPEKKLTNVIACTERLIILSLWFGGCKRERVYQQTQSCIQNPSGRYRSRKSVVIFVR